MRAGQVDCRGFSIHVSWVVCCSVSRSEVFIVFYCAQLIVAETLHSRVQHPNGQILFKYGGIYFQRL